MNILKEYRRDPTLEVLIALLKDDPVLIGILEDLIDSSDLEDDEFLEDWK